MPIFLCQKSTNLKCECKKTEGKNVGEIEQRVDNSDIDS